MGHGFGATTAISFASKDKRIKKVISLDPWLMPIKDVINDNTMKLMQPHCSVNTEIF